MWAPISGTGPRRSGEYCVGCGEEVGGAPGFGRGREGGGGDRVWGRRRAGAGGVASSRLMFTL